MTDVAERRLGRLAAAGDEEAAARLRVALCRRGEHEWVHDGPQAALFSCACGARCGGHWAPETRYLSIPNDAPWDHVLEVEGPLRVREVTLKRYQEEGESSVFARVSVEGPGAPPSESNIAARVKHAYRWRPGVAEAWAGHTLTLRVYVTGGEGDLSVELQFFRPVPGFAPKTPLKTADVAWALPQG